MRYVIAAIIALSLVGCKHAAAPVPHGTVYSIEVHPGDATATSLAGIASIVALGVGAIRTDYDPAQYSYAWLSTATAAGLKLDLITPYIAIGAPFDPASYAATCAAGARQFPGQTWEIINEPDKQAALDEQQLTPAQYVDLVDAVAPAIRAADPTATIIAGGTSGVDTAWLNAIAASFVELDGVAIHPYGIKPSGFGAAVATVTLVSHRPVYLTEWGEAPQVAGDVTSAVDAANGATPMLNFYELRTQPGEPPFGIAGTSAAAALTAALKN